MISFKDMVDSSEKEKTTACRDENSWPKVKRKFKSLLKKQRRCLKSGVSILPSGFKITAMTWAWIKRWKDDMPRRGVGGQGQAREIYQRFFREKSKEE